MPQVILKQGPQVARFAALSEAFETLKDPRRRAAYDQQWRTARNAGPRAVLAGLVIMALGIPLYFFARRK